MFYTFTSIVEDKFEDCFILNLSFSVIIGIFIIVFSF